MLFTTTISALLLAVPAVLAAPTPEGNASVLEKRVNSKDYPNIGFGQTIIDATTKTHWVMWIDGKPACGLKGINNAKLLYYDGAWENYKDHTIDNSSPCDANAFEKEGKKMKFGGCDPVTKTPGYLTTENGEFIRNCVTHNYKIKCLNIVGEHDIVQKSRCNK